MRQGKSLWLILLLMLLIVACVSLPSSPAPATEVTTAPPAEAINTVVSSPTPPSTLTRATEPGAGAETGEATVETPEPVVVERPPMTAKEKLSRDPVTAAEQATFVQLNENLPLERDDVLLAVAYKGVDLADVAEQRATPEAGPLPPGTRQQLYIHNHDDNTVASVEAELLAAGEHAYFWFDSTPGLAEPTAEQLSFASQAFDEIYEQVIFYFGPENNPGIDGDPRVHIVNASPLTICNVTEATADSCGLLGYFSSRDILPVTVDAHSNEREMFVMNGRTFGSIRYLDVLSHEFRHMIEERYDRNDIDWEVEGSAMLASDLLGFAAESVARANRFLANPDQQLNRWTDGNTIPHYGQGYLLNRYIFNRLGPELYRAFATHPAPGLDAIDEIAQANGLATGGLALWLDWLVALAIHNEPAAPEPYFLNEGIDTVAMAALNHFPATVETTVSQYAADYYQLFGEGDATLTFTGSKHTPLLKVLPASGEHLWLANRANYSHTRLTREFDLSHVTTANLDYVVYHDIEEGYDFAYVSASTDGGQTWQGLTADNMQGLKPEDDPSHSALSERFYTGHGEAWVKETADLTPYAGQVIQIRFEYITDPILTFGGIAFDNINIPEIGFFDDAETDMGWTAEGFVRATGYIPQQWHLQLITFDNGAPVVEQLSLNEGQSLSRAISLANSGGRPILIVAATAPMTLEPAHYRLDIQ